ncbi:MAG: hypothetical protein AAFO91_07540, partial [Bacteroidota bacterium]
GLYALFPHFRCLIWLTQPQGIAPKDRSSDYEEMTTYKYQRRDAEISKQWHVLLPPQSFGLEFLNAYGTTRTLPRPTNNALITPLDFTLDTLPIVLSWHGRKLLPVQHFRFLQTKFEILYDAFKESVFTLTDSVRDHVPIWPVLCGPTGPKFLDMALPENKQMILENRSGAVMCSVFFCVQNANEQNESEEGNETKVDEENNEVYVPDFSTTIQTGDIRHGIRMSQQER